MIIFTPNTVIKSADVNLNYSELLTSKSVDANGWTVYDMKTHLRYTYSLTSTAVLVTNGQRTLIGTVTGPAGLTVSGSYRIYCSWSGNYGGHAVVGAETPSGNTFGVYVGNQYSGGALNFTGKIHILVEQI